MRCLWGRDSQHIVSNTSATLTFDKLRNHCSINLLIRGVHHNILSGFESEIPPTPLPCRPFLYVSSATNDFFFRKEISRRVQTVSWTTTWHVFVCYVGGSQHWHHQQRVHDDLLHMHAFSLFVISIVSRLSLQWNLALTHLPRFETHTHTHSLPPSPTCCCHWRYNVGWETRHLLNKSTKLQSNTIRKQFNSIGPIIYTFPIVGTCMVVHVLVKKKKKTRLMMTDGGERRGCFVVLV